jgi:hypothetical protein
LQPIFFASWIAKTPTLVLPPLMNIVWPGSNFAIPNIAWYAVKPAQAKPEASNGVTFGGLITMSFAETKA